MQKQNTFSLCYNRMILMIAVILFGLLSVFWCHLPVHAATKDANGYTVATDLSGQAYAVFCEDNTTLYLLRNKTTGLAIGSSYTVTDTDGSTHSGVVTQNYLESGLGGVLRLCFMADE